MPKALDWVVCARRTKDWSSHTWRWIIQRVGSFECCSQLCYSHVALEFPACGLLYVLTAGLPHVTLDISACGKVTGRGKKISLLYWEFG